MLKHFGQDLKLFQIVAGATAYRWLRTGKHPPSCAHPSRVRLKFGPARPANGNKSHGSTKTPNPVGAKPKAFIGRAIISACKAGCFIPGIMTRPGGTP